MKIYVPSEIRTNARHSSTGKSALYTARPRRLDDDLLFNILQESKIQIDKKPLRDKKCQIDYGYMHIWTDCQN